MKSDPSSTAASQSIARQFQGSQDNESKSESVFSYYPLMNHFKVSTEWLLNDYYVAMLLPGNKNFISLSYIGKANKVDKEDNILFIVGLKFHISLPNVNCRLNRDTES